MSVLTFQEGGAFHVPKKRGGEKGKMASALRVKMDAVVSIGHSHAVYVTFVPLEYVPTIP